LPEESATHVHTSLLTLVHSLIVTVSAVSFPEALALIVKLVVVGAGEAKIVVLAGIAVPVIVAPAAGIDPK
jgi:hypothetical protein